MSSEILITELDKQRISKIIDEMYNEEKKLDKFTLLLKKELSRAKIVGSKQIPADVVTMNSRALVELDGEDVEVSLVYPDNADLREMKLSVFSPIGSALIGYKEGSNIEWEVPSGKSRLRIKKLLYQPEASGDFES